MRAIPTASGSLTATGTSRKTGTAPQQQKAQFSLLEYGVNNVLALVCFKLIRGHRHSIPTGIMVVVVFGSNAGLYCAVLSEERSDLACDVESAFLLETLTARNSTTQLSPGSAPLWRSTFVVHASLVKSGLEKRQCCSSPVT